MKDRTAELKETMERHPDYKLIFQYPGEDAEGSYYIGSISNVTLDKYYYDVENDLEYLASEDDENLYLTKVKETDWKGCIVVYIN